MPISVTITQPNVTDSFGRVLVVGATYSLGDDLAKSLIGQGKATAVSAYPGNPPNAINDQISYAGSPIGNVPPARVGQQCQDTTTGVMYTATTTAASGWRPSSDGVARSNAGSPVGVLTPDFIGQRCQDTTTGLMYVAQTLSSTGWTSFVSSTLPLGAPVQNFKAQSYKNARAALNNVRVGASNMQVLCLGDSTTAGYNEAGLANELAFSWPTVLAKAITSGAVSGSSGAVFGGWQNNFGNHLANAASSTIDVIDTRITAPPAGWSNFDAANAGVGGYLLVNSSNTNPLTFTPVGTTDTLDVFFLDGSGYDPFVVTGGAAGATASSPTAATITGTSTIKKATFTCSGTSVWKIAKAAADGKNLIIVGFSAYNAANKEISFFNCGVHSQQLSYLTTTGSYWFTLDQFTRTTSALTSPLAIISYGINDWVAGVSQATFTANLNTVINACKAANSDVLLVVPPPSPTATASAANQQNIINAYYAVAAAQDLALIDLSQRWTSQAVSQPLNYYRGSVDVHPSKMGYADMAHAIRAFFNMLM